LRFVRFSLILGINVLSVKAKNLSISKRGAIKMAYMIGSGIDPCTVPKSMSNNVLLIPSMLT
jgi:hypothetical protein